MKRLTIAALPMPGLSRIAAERTKLSIGLLILLSVNACVTGSRAGNCAGWSRAEYTAADIEVISEKLARWLDQHDSHYEATCGR